MAKTHYFDHMASTPIDPVVIDAMVAVMRDPRYHANPAAIQHAAGYQTAELIQDCRQQVAVFLGGVDPEGITWTSGATESIYLALLGAAEAYRRQGTHIITFATEHKATLNACQALEKKGFTVTVLPVETSGHVSMQRLRAAIRADTILISVMHVNNETGLVQPVEDMISLAHEHGCLLHVDAAQSVGRLPLYDLAPNVDLLSFCIHKCHGPKGIGVLYRKTKPLVRLIPAMGVDRQGKLRAGTLATHQIVGLTEALRLASTRQAASYAHVEACQTLFRHQLAKLPGILFNTRQHDSVPHCCSFHVAGVSVECLLADCYEFALSTGSACNSATEEPSHVLVAMGFSPIRAHHSLRVGFSHTTQLTDVEALLQVLTQAITRLRHIAPTDQDRVLS